MERHAAVRVRDVLPSVLRVGGGDDDAELVSRVVRRDRGAFRVLYQRWCPVLFGVARRLAADALSAEDLVHDVFVDLWSKPTQFDQTRGSLRMWMVLKLRSKAFSRRQQNARSARRDHLFENGRGRSYVPNVEASLSASVLCRRLAPDHRAVVLLTVLRGVSCAAAAKQLGEPVGTIKSRLARAFDEMRRAHLQRGRPRRAE